MAGRLRGRLRRLCSPQVVQLPDTTTTDGPSKLSAAPRRGQGRKIGYALAISIALLAVTTGALVVRHFNARRSAVVVTPFQRTELSILRLEQVDHAASGEYEVGVESSSTAGAGVGHYGWKLADGPARSRVGVEVQAHLQLSACSPASKPELNRAGVGAFLRRRRPNRRSSEDQIFAFTGILRARGVEGVAEDSNHVFYVVMQCTAQCRVLPEYVNRGAPPKILSFRAEPIAGEHVEVAMHWDRDHGKLEFVRDSAVWGEVPIDVASEGFIDAKFDVAHFLPGFADQACTSWSEVTFSNVVAAES